MPQIVEITINKVELAVRRDDDADVFVGFCPRFKVYSQGVTSEEALDAVTGAVVLRIATAFEHGRLDKVLRQAGFDRLASGSTERWPSPDDEFVSLRFKDAVEVTERDIRVPLGALLHQRSIECRHSKR
jgi:predicted RNase H-like HicB family nuclease